MADSSDPDSKIPGISSIFTTTQSGLKPLRRRSRTVEKKPDEKPAERPAPPETEEPPEATPAVQDLSPPEPPADTPPPVDGAGIQLSGGLSMVDTAELKSLRPPAAAPVAPEPEPPPVQRGPPVPPTPPPNPEDSYDEESEDYEPRYATPAPKTTNWLLYGVVVVVVVGLVAALVITVMQVTG